MKPSRVQLYIQLKNIDKVSLTEVERHQDLEKVMAEITFETGE